MSIIDESYDVNNPYFQNHSYMKWLESFTIDETMPEDRRPSYAYLLKKLWAIEWEGNHKDVGNDIDRVSDGFDLRFTYNRKLYPYDKLPIDSMFIFGKVRVLEVLVALSMHMYDLMQDTDIYNSVSRWFWEIMSNVGLDCLDDDCYTGLDGDEIVEEVVMDILKRSKKSIMNGWFGVEDWRDLGVWYQMHEYILDYF